MACNNDNSQRVFENFASTWELVGSTERGFVWWTALGTDMSVEFEMRNVSRCWEINVPESLFDVPLLGGFFRDLNGIR